uniref:NADH-ubiquinone oxidoreductase chain 6 n=1 Tax=Pityogenes trepanatus TaxID=445567 RepID=A0A343A5K6_9CUCU|nr:NADH dehydrogenase subunit 6 [Pityogenes trepanatus]
MSFLILASFSLSTMFIFMNHPLALGSNLFLQTTLIALISGKLISNFWYSYLLFLIMVGGMLILFIYMTSIASNEKFFVPKFYKLSIFIMFLFMIIILMFTFKDTMIEKGLSTKWNFMFESFNYYKPWTLSKFFNDPFYQIIIFLMIYLFLTLLMTVKVTDTSGGSLRQK